MAYIGNCNDVLLNSGKKSSAGLVSKGLIDGGYPNIVMGW